MTAQDTHGHDSLEPQVLMVAIPQKRKKDSIWLWPVKGLLLIITLITVVILNAIAFCS